MAQTTSQSLFQPEVEAQGPKSLLEAREECSSLHRLGTPNSDVAGGPAHPERAEVHDFGDECFLLRGLLTEREATFYVEAGEQLGFEEIRGAKPSHRNMVRVMAQSPELAELLWARVHPFLTDLDLDGDPHQVHVHGASALLQGTWKPSGINDVFRLCKYAPGGHFAPHFDGHLDKSPTVRTMKTLMLYLNGDFEGGSTNFVDESQLLYQDSSTGRYCAEEKNIMCSIKPEAGLGIIFNHHRLHEGQATRGGCKYILRTDVLFERVAGPKVSSSDCEALLLVQEAEMLEGRGHCMEAMSKYRRAFKMSPSLAEAFGS